MKVLVFTEDGRLYKCVEMEYQDEDHLENSWHKQDELESLEEVITKAAREKIK